MKSLHFTHYLSSMIEPACHALITQLQEQLTLPVHVISGDWPERLDALQNRIPQLAWVCGLLHVMNSQETTWQYEPIAAPVMQGDRYNHRPVYFTDVIVRAVSDYDSMASLAGARWGINETISFSGYHMLKSWMRQHEIPDDFFGEQVITGTHLYSITAVQTNRADFATIDSTTMDMLQRERPDALQNLRVIQSIGPFPAPPIVLSRHCPQALKDALRSILFDLHHEAQCRPYLEQIGINAFVPVDDGYYDQIRALELNI